jgi:Histone methylation protein DOT1
MIATVVDVSTIINHLSTLRDIDRCLEVRIQELRIQELRQFLHRARDWRHLLWPEHLAKRLNALDELDAFIGALDPGLLKAWPDPELIARAKTLMSQFEAANEMLYKAARAEIALQGNSSALVRWLMDLANDGDAEGARQGLSPGLSPVLSPGLSFDLLDEILCGILQLHEPGEVGFLPSSEMTAYQPTPARHILELIAACNFSKNDVLVDLGSGLGHVPLLVSILTGICTLGVEVQPDYVTSAREAAQRLNLSRVRFTAEDARMTDLSVGTVFYLFSPFKGSILTDVLNRLREEAAERPIRICSLGPCTRALQDQTWLLSSAQPDTGRITVFKSE